MNNRISGRKSGADTFLSREVQARSRVIYERNMDALQTSNPELAQRVEMADVDPIVDVVMGNETANLYLKKDGFFYYDHSNILGDVNNQFASLELRNVRFGVFLGIGLGYELQYFVGQFMKDHKTEFVFVIEKEIGILKAAMKTTDLTPFFLSDRFTFFVGLDQEELFLRLTDFLRENPRLLVLLKTMKPMYNTSALRMAKDYYLTVLKTITDSGVYQLSFFGNDPYDSLIGIENMLGNVREIVSNPGINLLYDKFEGKPAIIASTGPSLNKNKHLLKGLEDKALIICPDASLRVLLNDGIKPHLVTSLERVPETVKLMEGFSHDDVSDIYYAACPVVRPEAYQAYPGPRVIVYRNFDHFRWLGIERGILDIKHSSGNMAFKIAASMGCNPIILIGQDLAFSRDGKTHASGSTYGEDQNVNKDQVFEVMGNDGEPILTNATWNEFRKGFEIDIQEFPGRCINATEGGAMIYGAEVMSFASAIEQAIEDPFHPREKLRTILNKFRVIDIERDVDEVLSVIDETLSDLECMSEDCAEGLKLVRENKWLLEDFLGSQDDCFSNGVTLDKLETEILAPKKRISEYQETLQLFLMHIVQSFILKFSIDLIGIDEKYECDQMARAAGLLIHHKWYEVMYGVISKCIVMLGHAKKDLESYGSES